MTQVTVEQASERLATLLKKAADGEEVVITSPDGHGFRLVPIPASAKIPRFGIARGTIRMAEDFDDPLPEFAEYGP